MSITIYTYSLLYTKVLITFNDLTVYLHLVHLFNFQYIGIMFGWLF